MRNLFLRNILLCGLLVFVLAAALLPLAFATPVPQTAAPALSQPPVASTPMQAPTAKVTSYTLPPELLQKAHWLYRTRFAIRVISTLYGIFALWLVLQAKWGATFRDLAERASRIRFVQALVFTPLLVIALALLQLPVDLFSEWLSKRYGISVQTWASWFGDWGKAQFLTIVIGGILAWILYAIIRRSPQRWWLYFWIILQPILVFLVFISPYVIDPMFNKYEPLVTKAPQLVPKLQAVSRHAGLEIPPERMFWMKASDKTIGTNASVNGFGASKRIIVWDTTLAQETEDEVLGDFGHETGHYALGHIWKGVVFFAVLSFVLLWLGKQCIGWLLAKWRARWGVRGVDDWASLPALLLIMSVFGIVSNAAGNTFSRFQENQADIYGLEVTHGIVADPGQACATSFQKYGETVFVEPNPYPIDVIVFFDHPTVRDRIRQCATYDPWGKGESPQFVK